MSEIAGKIRNYLSSQAATALDGVSDQDSLVDREIIDSVAMLGLISFVEDEFNIRIKDDEILPDNFSTIQSISALVQRKL